MKTENIVFLVGGAVLGWYLATNKRKQTERALELAKQEVNKLGGKIDDLLKENDRLSELAVTEDVNNNIDLGV